MLGRDRWPPDPGAIAARDAAAKAVDKASGQPPTLVHIVDDDAGDRAVIDAILRDRGYPTQTWSSVDAFRSGLDTVERGVVVIDLCVGGIDGPALLHRLATLPCALPAIILSRNGNTRQATAAMKAGAIDFLEKPADPDAFCQAVAQAAHCLLRRQRQAAMIRDAQRRIALLSPREREVLAGLVAGASNKVMAQDLAISARTVEIHRAKVMAKLKAHSLAELIRIALAAETPPADAPPSLLTFVGQ